MTLRWQAGRTTAFNVGVCVIRYTPTRYTKARGFDVQLNLGFWYVCARVRATPATGGTEG